MRLLHVTLKMKEFSLSPAHPFQGVERFVTYLLLTRCIVSSGWGYFEQVEMMRRSILEVPTLYELQFYCVSDSIFFGSCWMLTWYHKVGYNLYARHFKSIISLDIGCRRHSFRRRAGCTSAATRWPQVDPFRRREEASILVSWGCNRDLSQFFTCSFWQGASLIR